MSGDGEATQTVRTAVIEATARSAEGYGLNRSYGHLYGELFFADEPLSLDDLVDLTGYAKSTVSTAMQDMERLHIVRRRSMLGEGKRLFFEAETDLWEVVQQVLGQKVGREVHLMTRALDEAVAELDAIEDERAAADLEKVRSLRSQYREAERVLEVVSSTPADRLHELVTAINDRD